jgi:hypothetical protein
LWRLGAGLWILFFCYYVYPPFFTKSPELCCCCSGQKKWDDAGAACKAFGWKLAEITSATEQRKIVSFRQYLVWSSFHEKANLRNVFLLFCSSRCDQGRLEAELSDAGLVDWSATGPEIQNFHFAQLWPQSALFKLG